MPNAKEAVVAGQDVGASGCPRPTPRDGRGASGASAEVVAREDPEHRGE